MTKAFRTHYDNLMVSRTAPPEVISAAYRALSKQFHPDRNPDNLNTENIMRIINIAHNVLSDPLKRHEHDLWIIERESTISGTQQSKNTNNYLTPLSTAVKVRQIVKHLIANWRIYLGVGILAVTYWAANSPRKQSGLPEYIANPSYEQAENAVVNTNVKPKYQRPGAAPNGKKWPNQAAYIPGYPLARADGLSKLTIDNSSNSSDMFVKLVALSSNKTVPVRHIYIPANESFTMNKIRAGLYDVRYMDLSDGGLSRSESLELQEIQELSGVSFSVTTLTLYKVANGNTQTYALAENEF